MPPGAPPGTIPTDLEQATGLERLEILGKMQGVDIFDMRPLDASRVGMLRSPGFPTEQKARSRERAERKTDLATPSQAPLRIPSLSTPSATSSTSAALAARPTPTTSSGSPPPATARSSAARSAAASTSWSTWAR